MIIVILSIVIAILILYVIILSRKNKVIVSINNETIKKNEELGQELLEKLKDKNNLNQEIEERQVRLDGIKESIKAQDDILQSLNKTNENLRQQAEQNAQTYYQDLMENKKVQYQAMIDQQEQNYKKVINTLEEQRQKLISSIEQETQKFATLCDEEEAKLEDLKAKQRAYVQAQQREEAIAANTDYYRLAIDAVDLHDITLLRDLQKHFSRKDVIDKLIWDYYKSAYDTLMLHISENKNKICGIYRITDLTTGQSYVGQSVDVRERFRSHVKAGLAYGKASNKLYQAMQSHGVENFTFEILEEVSKDKLNEREIYWIDFYQTKELGMNATRGGA